MVLLVFHSTRRFPTTPNSAMFGNGQLSRVFPFGVMMIICLAVTSLPAEVASETSSRYRARVRVYVDKAGVEEFNWNHRGANLTEHVESMFVTVNKAYRSLLPTIDLTLEIEQVIALDKNIFKHILKWKGDLAIINDWTGYEFWEWAKKTYDAKEYDLAVLLTGFEMYSRGTIHPGTFGHGYTASVCSENGVAAVEIQEPAGTLGLIHEIGHIMGAEHDEESPKRLCTPDTYQSGNIMNKYTKVDSPLRYTFSKCSLLQISENFANLTKRHNNCLKVSGGEKNDKSDGVPALQTTADELCEKSKGKGWEMHRSHYSKYGDRFCQDVKCLTFENGDRKISDTLLPAPDGLKCGKSKRCYQQKCVLVTNGNPDVSDTCPWGSQGQEYVREVYRSSCPDLSCDGYGRMCCGRCPR